MTTPSDGDWPTVDLAPWTGPVPPTHPDANFLADIATVSLADPMPTLTRLAEALDVPVGSLARYVLAKWTTAGSEALLAVGPAAVERVREVVDRVVDAPTSAARDAAVADLVEQVQWLAHGVDRPSTTYPEGGAVPREG